MELVPHQSDAHASLSTDFAPCELLGNDCAYIFHIEPATDKSGRLHQEVEISQFLHRFWNHPQLNLL